MRQFMNILTPRQTDCLFFLARGLTAKQIALELGISSRTVEFHIEVLKRKLDCPKKTSLIQKAWKMNFIRQKLFDSAFNEDQEITLE